MSSGFLKRCQFDRSKFGRCEHGGLGLGLAAVRDLRERRAPASAEELAQFETDVLAGFVLARASAGLTDGTIRGDVGQLEQIRAWFGRRCGRWSRRTPTPTSGG